MIPYQDLSELDLQLLNAIYQNQPISVKELDSLLQNQHTVRLRIKLLAEPDWVPGIRGMKFAVDNTSYVSFDDTGAVRTTELGKRAVEEWHLQKKAASRKLWEIRLWKFFPICISLLALIVETVSLLEALRWIHLEQ